MFYKPSVYDRYLEALNPKTWQPNTSVSEIFYTLVLIDLLSVNYDDTIRFGQEKNSDRVYLKFENFVLSWYSSYDRADASAYQFNSNNMPYYWFAI